MSKITNPNLIAPLRAVNLVDSTKKAVIFWDTCALLDIVRLPIRNGKVNALKNIIEIKDRIVANDVVSLSSKLCVDEFNNNIDSAITSLQVELKKTSNFYNSFVDYINELSISATTIAHVDFSLYKLDDQLVQIVNAIIQRTYFVEEHDSYGQFAHFRLTQKIAPAKVKGEYKDCYIWGTCLDIRRNSVDKTYSYSFLSSNVSDYADSTKVKFADEVLYDANNYDITFFPNFGIAYANLKKAGIIKAK